jgi:hypothetical protein
MFNHNSMILKEKGLLVLEQSLSVLGETPISAPYRSYIESFIQIADLLAA